MKEDVGIADTSEAEPEHVAAGLVLAIKDWRVWWLAIVMTLQLLALSFNGKPFLTCVLDGLSD
jgi:hypothetical protein